MAERSKAAASKAVISCIMESGVRIPLSPPIYACMGRSFDVIFGYDWLRQFSLRRMMRRLPVEAQFLFEGIPLQAKTGLARPVI